MLLALDPGMNSPGAALFLKPSGVVWRAARIAIPDAWSSLADGQRWLEVAQKIVEWATTAADKSSIDEVIFERPQWYARGKSKGDPNQLAGVVGVAACVVGCLAHRHHLNVLSPTPAEWIGQLPKVCPVCKGKAKKKCTACLGSAWKTPRGKRIMSRLTPAELALVSDQNDAIDSVGIGLWACGRLERVSVFSNGNDGR